MGRRDGLGSGIDDVKNWLFTTLSPPAARVSEGRSEHSLCLLEGCGADCLPPLGSDIALLGGCGAVLGFMNPAGIRERGVGTAAQLFELLCCSSKACWLGDGVKQLGSSSAKGVRLALKNESMGLEPLESGV
jgi:hypothetical protein